MESNFAYPLIMQLAGVAVVIAEIILPSGGLLSLLAAALFGYSIYAVYTGVSVVAGVAIAVADLIMVPILVVVGLKLISKSPATLRSQLLKKEGVTAQKLALDDYAGLEGEAITDLRPAGKALIAHRRVDVVSRGDYIEKGATIVVVEVIGNQVIVRKV
jgi:membrane-bound serine protease (ClpP class)